MPQQNEGAPGSGLAEPSHQSIMEELIAIPVDGFFAEAVERLSTMLDAPFVVITESCDTPPGRVKTLAFWGQYQLRANIEYCVLDTPCEKVTGGELCFYSENIQQLFPKDQFFIEHNIVSYIAVPLFNASHDVIGHLAVMDTKTLKNERWLFSVLNLYAGRVAVEMERFRTQDTIDALIKGYCLPIGEVFFQQLAKIIGDICDVDFAVIGQLSNSCADVVHSLAVYHRGKILEPLQYSLRGSPCETVVGKNSQAYPLNVQAIFPDVPLLKAFAAGGYIGTPLFDPNNKSIGLLLVINQGTINNVNRVTPILEAFASRASYEIERQRNEQFVQHYHEILSATGDLMSLVDTNYVYRAVNSAYCKKFNKPMSEIVNHSVAELHGEDVFYDDLKDCLDRSLAGQATKTEFEIKAPDGTVRWILSQHNPSYDPDNNIIGVVGSAIDITELKTIQQALAKSEQRLQSMYDDTPSMFFTVDRRSIIISVNAYGAKELGYRGDELLGSNMSQLFQHQDQDIFIANLEKCFAQPDVVQSWELRKIHKSGKVIWVKETARVVENQNHQSQLFIVSEDISEKHKLSQKLSYQASHDSLTDLFNRHEFERLLQQLLDARVETGAEHVLCYLDLDQFKFVNDACGHLAGDILLKNISEILRLKVRKSDVLARLGGDEFAILMEYCSLEQAKHIADAIRQLIQDYKFIWKDKTYSIGVSIGVVVIDAATDTITKVMGAVDKACYAAKDGGRNRVHVYQESDKDISRRRGEMEWARRIKRAITENKFCLYAQKIIAVNARSASKPSYELLVRLNDSGKVILPDSFLPAAERYHLATRIDEWVVVNAFRWLASSKSKINEMDHCAINLSGYSLSDEDFLDYVLFQFKRFKLPGNKICFEVTETAAISNFAGAIRFINEFRQRGCFFALDDFGSGVSSFGYLKNLPVDFVKIDGCFVTDMVDDPIDHAMVRSINEIAHVMNKKTIAEYVETEQTFECLRKIGVDYAQGHYVGEPVLIS